MTYGVISLAKRIDNAFAAVIQAVESGGIPGAVLGVTDASGAREVRVCGCAQNIPICRPLLRDTWFDLASLTKVIFTAPRILKLHEQGALDIYQPLVTKLPDLDQYHSDSWIRSITFAQCLSHCSGLPAVWPVYTYGTDPSQLRAFVLQRSWPKSDPVYSDINYILLGLALERIHGSYINDIDAGAGFAFSADASNAAATEWCHWRETMLCGEVHDENCHALQGAGHAGLFGTIDSILDYANDLLNGSAHSKSLISMMREPVSKTRTLGWERFHDQWAGGTQCSLSTIGHTGFTGTGLWIDFDRDCAWSLLTNRIHPTRHHDSGIHALRQLVGNRISAL